MDKKDWSWMKQHMPGVVALLREYREAGEGAHVDECWLKGVIAGQPGWLFAREGPICLGTPFDERSHPILCDLAVKDWRRAGVVLMLAPLPGGIECRRLNADQINARSIADVRAREAQRQADVQAGRRAPFPGEVVHGAH